MTTRTPAPRLLMWIDAVGGYLVCLEDEIVLGPAGDGVADVPILGDVSRRHAVIRRDGEGYLIEPHRPVRVDGASLERSAPLSDGSRIELGESVQLCFRKPHPLSRTARLDIFSRHKTEPAVDGIVLMADSLIVGPGTQNHVVCRDWRQDLVLFRQGDALCCRSKAAYEVDGIPREGKTEIGYNARVTGEDFAMRIEQV